MMPHAIRQQAAGYVLVEAMIGVLIVGAMTGLLFETVGGRARMVHQIEQRRTAIMVARSQLAAAMTATNPAGEGDWGALHWTVSVEPRDAGARGSALVLDDVTVSVVDSAAPSRSLVVLKSLKPQ